MQRYLFYILIGVVGTAITLGGCAKRVKPEAAAPVKEEKVAAPETPEAVEQPAIGESEVSAKEEMAESKMGEPSAGLTSVYFDFDKSTIREDMRAPLEANGRWLLANPKAALTIEGHADERGTNEYNLALGERRARATKQFLAAMGVDTGRLSTISYGEEKPVCKESQEDCWWKNRRAQFGVQGQ